MSPEKISILAGSFLLIAWILYLMFRRAELKLQIRVRRIEYQNRILEKCANTKEFMEFLKSEHGAKVLDYLDEGGQSHLVNHVLWAVGFSIILLLVGIGLFICGLLTKEHDYFIWAFILGALGAGFFLAARVSRALALKWGLMEPGLNPRNG